MYQVGCTRWAVPGGGAVTGGGDVPGGLYQGGAVPGGAVTGGGDVPGGLYASKDFLFHFNSSNFVFVTMWGAGCTRWGGAVPCGGAVPAIPQLENIVINRFL